MHYRNFSFAILTVILTTLAFSSCSKKLSNEEKQILRWDIPLDMYEDNLNSILESYIENVCAESVDLYYNDTKREMDRLSTNPFGLYMLMAEEEISMFAGNRSLSQKLEDYRSNCIQQLDNIIDDFIPDYTDLIISSTSADNWGDFTNEHPILSLRDYADIDEEGNLDLGALASLEGVPGEVDVHYYDSLANVTRLQETLTEPSINTCVDLFGKIATPKDVDIIYLITAFNKWASVLAENYPIPVYAWYDKEQEWWEVGYDNEEALHVRFQKVNGVIHYQYKQDAEYNVNHLQGDSI